MAQPRASGTPPGPLALPAPPSASDASKSDLTFPDDDQKLSSSYRFVGGLYKHGARAVIPRRLSRSQPSRRGVDQLPVVPLGRRHCRLPDLHRHWSSAWNSHLGLGHS
eukprot:12320398-Alexandrium_andersonii.AAC.1